MLIKHGRGEIIWETIVTFDDCNGCNIDISKLIKLTENYNPDFADQLKKKAWCEHP